MNQQPSGTRISAIATLSLLLLFAGCTFARRDTGQQPELTILRDGEQIEINSTLVTPPNR